ncbi:MAG: hypothetical protein NWE98_06120 [Candidatus Bathyarchaeota archaeon]|nr:hypothetical protein [Candidatus Bathyarchaeota archaeon]
MMDESRSRTWVLIKKIFSVALVFNALLTVACCVSILGGFYWFYENWKPFQPYLLDGNLFWVAIAAAVINLFPSASLGRALKTGRFLFHHYFYGFLVLLCAVVYVVVFTPASLFTLFLRDDTSVSVNVGRFFVLGGSALVLDDLPDVSKRIDRVLCWMKAKAFQWGRVLGMVQLLCGTVSSYVFIAVCLSVWQHPEWVTLANFILIGSLFVTSFTSFLFVKRRVWTIGDTDKKQCVTVH